MAGKVTIIENGRDGQVLYHEGPHTINGYWEFGGNDVVTIVSMGDRDEWRNRYPWALDRRSEILRFVADEVIRMRAPTCTAVIDEASGTILLKAPGAIPTAADGAEMKASGFVKRYSKIKAMVGIGVLALVLIAGAVLWMGKKVLMVAPANGVPLNECVRTEHHIASFIQYTDPHLPRVTGRGGNETTSISILLIPLDGTEPRVVPVVRKLDGVHYELARIMGSDGHTLWLDCTGLFGVRLSDYELITAQDLQRANPAIDPRWWADTRGMAVIDGKLHIMNDDRSAALDVEPTTWKATTVDPKPSKLRFDRLAPTDQLAAGLITSGGTWLGLHSPEELDGEFKVKSWIKRVEQADDAKQLRRFCAAHLEASSEGDHFRILDMAPIGTTEYLNAAFLRMGASAEPLRLKDPESVLMIHTDAPGLGGKLVVSRADTQGHLLWSTETGLDRYYVSQILPGADAFAFVGTRPPVEGKLSEPLVVLVDNATGRHTAHSLWR
ncbi:MAG: hypothetical protein IPJ76_14870 [Flavobacteriales bacterium]|nr:MAG: hypothetical protein IPJ76_14870 [Flavobacteriales bacterium]